MEDVEASSSRSQSAASISITPLAGSQTSSTRALCHLLEFDDAKILLDCGINSSREEFSYDDHSSDRIEYLDKLRELAPQLTLILLSAPTIEALGLLPYFVSKLRIACPIYATFQCRALGQLTLEDWIQARCNEEAQNPSSSLNPPPTPSLQSSTTKSPRAATSTSPTARERADDVAWRVTKEEIQLSFSRITPVVYSQVVRLSGRSNAPFSLLPHPAGTTLGATLWSLRSATTDSLLYAPTFNHTKERTLDPAAFLIKGKDGRMEVNEAMRRVGILVIGAERSRSTATKAKERDQKLLDIVSSTLQAGGSILMPSDTAGRFVEILVLLEQHWAYRNFTQEYPLCLLSRKGDEVLAAIRGMADSLGGLLGADEAERERVLRFRNVQVIESPEELHSRYGPIQPKLVLCAPSSLSYGPSRDTLASTFLSSRNSLVILTSPGSPGSLASHLFELWNDSQTSTSRYGSGKVGEVVDFDDIYGAESSRGSGGRTSVRLKMKKKQVLAGEELMQYLEDQRQTKEREQKAKAMAERNRRMMEADAAGNDSSDSDDSDESDSEGAQARAVMDSKRKDGSEGPQGVGIGPAAYAEPGSAPALRTEKKGGISKYGYDANMTATGTGAWDEFLDDSRGAQMGGFDIYVRQPATKGIAGGGSGMANQSTKYRMFPFFERRRKVDGYGEAIDIEGWKTRNKAPEEIEAALAEEANGVLGKRKRDGEDIDAAKEKAVAPEPPHKFVIQDITVQVRCKILAVDMEGKADGRALRSILPLIEPKKLVLINGSPEATQDLASALQTAALAAKDIYAPFVGDCTKIADVTKSFSVRLDDSLMAALALRKIDEYEVVPVKAVIGTSDESTLPVLVAGATLGQEEPLSIDEDTDMQISDALPKLRAPHFIGDIKLALLKANLTDRNVPVAFQKGTLVCGPVVRAIAPAKQKEAKPSRLAKLTGQTRPSPTPDREDEVIDTSGGKVVVRREGTQLLLEGAPGDTFYTVRSAIYDLHAIAS